MNYPHHQTPSSSYSPREHGSQAQTSQVGFANQSTQPGSLQGSRQPLAFDGPTRTNTLNTPLPSYSGVSAGASPPTYAPPTEKQKLANYFSGEARKLRLAEASHLQASNSRSNILGRGKSVKASQYGALLPPHMKKWSDT